MITACGLEFESLGMEDLLKATGRPRLWQLVEGTFGEFRDMAGVPGYFPAVVPEMGRPVGALGMYVLFLEWDLRSGPSDKQNGGFKRVLRVVRIRYVRERNVSEFLRVLRRLPDRLFQEVVGAGGR